MKKDTGGPAFPLVYDVPPENVRHVYQGMTLRDYFAAKAMQGLIAEGATGYEDIAFFAYKYADAMLKAREE